MYMSLRVLCIVGALLHFSHYARDYYSTKFRRLATYIGKVWV